MFRRLAALVAAGVLATAGLATSTAHASAPVVRDTIQVRNYLDNGTHGYWAWRNFARTTVITKVAEGGKDAQGAELPDTYTVQVTDLGSMRTIKGRKSPQNGVTIANAVDGNSSGSFTSTVQSVSAPSAFGVKPVADFNCNLGSGTRATDCTGPEGIVDTHDWWKLYFTKGEASASGGTYQWTHRSDCERWIESNTGSVGDVTGKRCDRAARADAPSVVQPECGADRGTLTVPKDLGVYYRVNGKLWKAGEHKVLPGRYVVTAHDRDGYKLVGDRVWKLTVDKAEPCPTPTPTPDPTVSPSPTTEPTTPADDPAETPVATPKAPTLAQATCADKTASVSIPEAEGVVYRSGSGKVLEQGKTYSVTAGKVTIVATAADGYALPDGADVVWPLVVSEAPACEPTATPTSTQRVVVVNNIPVPSRVDTGFGGLAR